MSCVSFFFVMSCVSLFNGLGILPVFFEVLEVCLPFLVPFDVFLLMVYLVSLVPLLIVPLMVLLLFLWSILGDS